MTQRFDLGANFLFFLCSLAGFVGSTPAHRFELGKTAFLFFCLQTRCFFQAQAFGFRTKTSFLKPLAFRFGAFAKLSFKLQAFLLDTPARFFLSLQSCLVGCELRSLFLSSFASCGNDRSLTSNLLSSTTQRFFLDQALLLFGGVAFRGGFDACLFLSFEPLGLLLYRPSCFLFRRLPGFGFGFALSGFLSLFSLRDSHGSFARQLFSSTSQGFGFNSEPRLFFSPTTRFFLSFRARCCFGLQPGFFFDDAPGLLLCTNPCFFSGATLSFGLVLRGRFLFSFSSCLVFGKTARSFGLETTTLQDLNCLSQVLFLQEQTRFFAGQAIVGQRRRLIRR
jgi:hypothetical protein